MKTFALAAAAFGLAIASGPAIASPHHGKSVNVTTAGLDLNTMAGQEMLDRRIERAAREVCQADAIRTGTRTRSTHARKCLAKARASAKRQVAARIEEQRRGG